MDTSDAAIEAEIDLDQARHHAQDSGRSRTGHQGERAVELAKGGVQMPKRGREEEDADESSPLIRQTSGDGGDGGDGHRKASWTGIDEFAHLPWYKRPSILWVLGPFFLMTLAFGGVITPKINLLLELICRQYMREQELADPNFWMAPVNFDGGDNEQCRIPEVQSRIATFTLWMSLITGLVSAFMSPKLGSLSDRHGRKPILIITSIGTLCNEIISIVAASNPESFSIEWFFVGAALDGLTGSFIVAIAIANSYATDCTPPAMRNVAFGMFHASLFTGLAIGPILAGYIVKWTGKMVVVFYILLAVHLTFGLFVALFVPESLSKKRQLAAKEKHRAEWERSQDADYDLINKLRSLNLFAPLKIFWPTGDKSSRALRRNLVFLAAVDTIAFGVAMGSMTVILIYTNYEFGWKTWETSQFMSIVNGSRVFCLLVVLPIITRLVRRGRAVKTSREPGCDTFDLFVIRIAILFDTIGYLGYTLARSDEMMLASGAVAAIGGIGSPTLQSALTKHVPADRTGQLLGASGLLHALARVVAPTVFNAIYAATVGKFTQTVFVCLTATFGLAFVLSWFIRPHGMSEPVCTRRLRRDD